VSRIESGTGGPICLDERRPAPAVEATEVECQVCVGWGTILTYPTQLPCYACEGRGRRPGPTRWRVVRCDLCEVMIRTDVPHRCAGGAR
jgi:DnaJ-class molecular chaperone